MPWVRLDEAMPDDPKVARLSDLAFRVYVSAICYSARNLTDGRVPARIANQFGGRGTRTALLQLLPQLWHERNDSCDSDYCQKAGLCDLQPGEYLIHNYHRYNPTKAAVLIDRANKSRAGKAGAQTRWQNE